MPLQKTLFKPGVNRENTRYTTEGGWYESNLVRFRQGNPETIGGWTPYTGNTFLGACRSLWNWITLTNQNLIGLGTNLKFYVEQGGNFNDITPIRTTVTLNPNPFTGDGTTKVVVNAPGHGAVNGDFVTFSGATGTYSTLLTGQFQINYINVDAYSITVSSALAVGSYGGSSVSAAYQINTGPSYAVPVVGWGAGGWGAGAWNVGGTTITSLRLWSQMNYGQDLVFGPRGGGMYYWQPSGYTFSRAVLLNSLGGQVTISLTAPTVITASKIFTDGTGLQFAGALPGGMLPNTTYYVFNSTGTTFNLLDADGNFVNTINSGNLTSAFASGNVGSVTTSVINTPQLASVSASGAVGTIGVSNLTLGGVKAGGGVGTLTVAGRTATGVSATASPGSVTVNGLTVPVSGVNASGVAGNLAITGTVTAYISLIVDVPTVQNVIFVSDTSKFVFAMGTNDYGSTTLDPMLIRWSDQGNVYEWTPDATNQAGSIRLSHGSEIITAVQTRQEIVVFTDATVYSLQYLGPPVVWSSQILGDNISIAGPNAATIASGIVYWMGVDKFYAYDGRVQTLNCDLRRHVFGDFNMSQRAQVYCSTNEGFNEVWWFYCSENSTQIDKYVIYNYLERVWYYGTLSRTAWFDSGLLPYPIATTYDPATATGRLINHESGLNDNTDGTEYPINAYISSSEFDIGDGHNFGFVWRILPDLTFSNSTNYNGTSPRVTMSISGLYNSGSGRIDTASGLVAKSSQYVLTEEFTGQIFTRIRGRQMVFKIESGQVNTAWQLGAPRIDIRPDGRR